MANQRHDGPHMAPFEESPEGVTGQAEVLGCLPLSMPPLVGADRPHEARSGLCRAVQRSRSWLQDNQ